MGKGLVIGWNSHGYPSQGRGKSPPCTSRTELMGNQHPSLTVLVEGSAVARQCTLPPGWPSMTIQQLKNHILNELSIPPPIQGISLQVKRRLKAPFQVSRGMTMKESRIASGKTIILTFNPTPPSTPAATHGFFAMQAVYRAYRAHRASSGSSSSGRSFTGEARVSGVRTT